MSDNKDLKIPDFLRNQKNLADERRVSASASNELLCAGNYFKRNFLGDFKPDERYIALIDRLQKYYADTPDSMDNKTALPYWIEFNRWCNNNNYTREEVNYAKSNTPA